MHAVALIMDNIRKNLGDGFISACHRNGITLEIYSPEKETYIDHFYSNRNIITWGVKMPQHWYHRHKRNVLFLENGLFSQRDGVWIDSTGWYSKSNFCKEKHYLRNRSPKIEKRLVKIAKKRFGWNCFEGGKQEGPILFAVQNERDAPCQYQFPLQTKGENNVLTALKLLRENVSDRPVLIRPHPKFMDKWDLIKDDCRRLFKKNWRTDYSKNVYNTLKQCSALVTVNSTLAVETLFLGIPVAVFGQSVYTGSDVVLDCSQDPSNLSNLYSHTISRRKRLNFLCACLQHQIPYKARDVQILKNEEFAKWVQRCQ